MDIVGKYNTAKVFTDDIGERAISQILDLCNLECYQDSIIRIMPDVHAGAGCTVGTTMTIRDKVSPNLVGSDIGCGMIVVKLEEKSIDLAKLDEVVHKHIPSGHSVRPSYHPYINDIHIDDLLCLEHIDKNKALLSIGTLGGGNHFIEVDKDDEGYLYLVIHSGSRHLGRQVCDYYQKLCGDNSYIDGDVFTNYLHDMEIVQDFAYKNREAMVDVIMSNMGLHSLECFTTIHNYIDINNMMLRKGAVSALKGEKLIIPLNMRDGSLLCIGKGNKDWNYSAPHGAGRRLSRSMSKEEILLEEYIDSMKGIYSTSVNKSTIDESPFAYKDSLSIIENISPAVEIIKIITPIYNFKAH